VSDGPCRLCLLVGSETVPSWFARAVERAVERTPAEVTAVVVAVHPSTSRPADPRRTSRNPVNRLAARLDAEPDTGGVHVTALEATAGAPVVFEQLAPETVVDGRVELPEPLVERIAAADVVVHLGVGILTGPILTEPAHGVVSYHEGDLRAYRGSSSGFWEFLEGEPTTAVTVQRLTETLDGGQIVVEAPVDIRDAGSVLEVRRRLEEASVPLMAEAIERLGRPEFDPETVSEDELGRLYVRADRNATGPSLRFLRRELPGRIRRLPSGPTDGRPG